MRVLPGYGSRSRSGDDPLRGGAGRRHGMAPGRAGAGAGAAPVVEEEVMVAVTVRREELESEREPGSRFDPPRRDAGEPAEALVMVLHEERPVVGVEVVPTEVVRVRRALVRGGERTVTDTVLREKIEVDGA